MKETLIIVPQFGKQLAVALCDVLKNTFILAIYVPCLHELVSFGLDFSSKELFEDNFALFVSSLGDLDQLLEVVL
jgi:hypothetical protein